MLICVPVCVSCVCATVLVVQYDHIIRPFMQQTIQSQITVGICVTLHQKAQIRKLCPLLPCSLLCLHGALYLALHFLPLLSLQLLRPTTLAHGTTWQVRHARH